MRRLRFRIARFAIVSSAVFLGVAAAGCIPGLLQGLPGLAGLFRQSSLELMATAEQMVAPAYPNALLIEVLGAPSGGTAQTADDVDRWQFRFSEDPVAPGAGTVWVDYENGAFAGPFYTEQGLVGTVYDPLPRTMSLADALARARAAGYTDDFSNVTYRLPLTFPQPEEALYALSMPGRFVIVGAVSGNVTEEASRTEPDFLTE